MWMAAMDYPQIVPEYFGYRNSIHILLLSKYLCKAMDKRSHGSTGHVCMLALADWLH